MVSARTSTIASSLRPLRSGKGPSVMGCWAAPADNAAVPTRSRVSAETACARDRFLRGAAHPSRIELATRASPGRLPRRERGRRVRPRRRGRAYATGGRRMSATGSQRRVASIGADASCWAGPQARVFVRLIGWCICDAADQTGGRSCGSAGKQVGGYAGESAGAVLIVLFRRAHAVAWYDVVTRDGSSIR